MIQDRPYQEECEATVLSEYDKGVRAMLISLATGTGKTIVFSQLYEKLKSRLPGQMLVLAHTEELVDQNLAKLREINPTVRVDKEMATHKADPSQADIIMASVPTLGRKGTKRVEKYNWENFDKVVVDEAHHSPAESYRRVIDLAIRPEWPTKLLLGTTATPQRSDGKALAEIFEKVAYVYSIRQAIEDGWLVDIKGFCVKTDTDISEVGKSGGDFVKSELEEKVNNPARNQRIVQAWLKIADSRPTVAFTVGIQHAKDLALMFQEAGVSAEAVWGDDPDRAEKLKRHREGKLVVLCNCGVLVEGYDDWRISCILLARPTQSPVLFTQMVGRGTRLQEGMGNLRTLLDSFAGSQRAFDGGTFPMKQDCIVIDVVDNSSKHSLVTLPTLMGLNAGLDLRGQSLVYAVKLIEEIQEKNPNADFSKLAALDDIEKCIAQVDLFNVRFPEEVEANSELTWYRNAGGGYRINIPKDGGGGHCSIFQNMLDQWEIDGVIGEGKFHGTGDRMENAFKACDEQIRKRIPELFVSFIARKATWHDKKASKGQWTMLKRLFPWKQFPDNLTKGQASRIIGERLAGKSAR